MLAGVEKKFNRDGVGYPPRAELPLPEPPRDEDELEGRLKDEEGRLKDEEGRLKLGELVVGR